MSILLTYTSALEAMRDPEFSGLAGAWDERTGHVPERLPTSDELDRIVRENPLLQRLSPPLHLLVSSDCTSHSSARASRHVTRVHQLRDSFSRIGEEAYVVSPELVPFLMARVFTVLEEALLMCELCGTYAPSASGMIQRAAPLTDRVALRDYLRRRGTGYGTRRVRSALPLVCADSGSPYESKLAIRLHAPAEQGGYGLDIVSMNEEVSLAAIGRAFDERQIRKPDILLMRPDGSEPTPRMPFRGVSVDYKGKVHDSPVVAEQDDTRRNELLAHGIKPYEIRKVHYDDIDYMDSIVQKICHDLMIPCDDLAFGRDRRIALHDELERTDIVHWGDRHLFRSSSRLVI